MWIRIHKVANCYIRIQFESESKHRLFLTQPPYFLFYFQESGFDTEGHRVRARIRNTDLHFFILLFLPGWWIFSDSWQAMQVYSSWRHAGLSRGRPYTDTTRQLFSFSVPAYLRSQELFVFPSWRFRREGAGDRSGRVILGSYYFSL